MDFRILGPVELRVNGQPYSFGSPKERCVLAVLLYELGQPVAVESLIDRVWGENLPESPRASLYSYLSRLRKNLKSVAGNDHALLRRRSGYYTLEADPAAVDLHRFRALRAQARAIGDSGDDARAAGLLRDAEQLWQGTPLAGLSGAWAERVRAALEEELLAATMDRIRVELRLGRHSDLVGELSDLVARHPFNETLIEYLMIALYRCGRQAEAMEVYRQTRRRLMSELGSEPGLGLRNLHQNMLNDDPVLVPELAARPAPQSMQANSLPRDNPDFTGRDSELDKLFGWIDSERAQSTVTVVAISGMPGAGKTTFAIHAAHLLSNRYPHLFYLGMHAHDPVEEPMDPASGLGILLRTLGVPPERIPASLEERATLWRTQLASRRALVIIDDADDPDQIKPLLPGAANCLVLITCRRRMLELPGVRWLPLGVMRPDEAASLFTHVAGAERAHDAAVIAQVVRLCGYLPLAIHLEGSRFRTHPVWSIRDLASRLSRSHDRLNQVPAEDREVAASFELSYRYLTNGQQRLLRQLALHPGAEFSAFLAAAASGGDSLAATEQALDALHDHHLLEEPEPGRFTFHDLIREYALRRAHLDDPEPDRHRTIHRILDYYLCLADRSSRIVYPFHRRLGVELTYAPTVVPPLSIRIDCRKWIEAEWANITSMVHYAARSNGWKQHIGLLPHVLAPFLDSWGFWSDAASLHRLAARTWQETSNARGEARALTDLCIVLVRAGLYAEAAGCAQNALEICRAEGDRAGEADALDHMGLLLWQSSRFREALSCHEKALAIWRAIHDRHGEADALGHVGMSLTHISQYKDALKAHTGAFGIYQEIGDLRGEASSLNNIADAQQHLGFHEEALDRYQRALIMSRDIGDRQGEAILFNNIGNVYHHTGRHDESLNYYRKALSIYRDIGDSRCEADTINNIGAAFQGLGHYSEALMQHQKALILAHQLAEPYQQARSLCNMGNARRRNNEYALAAEDYRAALELSLQIGDPYQEGLAEEGLGSVLLHIGGEAAAKERWKKALTLFEQIGVPEADSVRDLLRTVGTSLRWAISPISASLLPQSGPGCA